MRLHYNFKANSEPVCGTASGLDTKSTSLAEGARCTAHFITRASAEFRASKNFRWTPVSSWSKSAGDMTAMPIEAEIYSAQRNATANWWHPAAKRIRSVATFISHNRFLIWCKRRSKTSFHTVYIFNIYRTKITVFEVAFWKKK